MPGINVSKEYVLEHLGREYDYAKFEELCFQFGVELEEEHIDPTTETPTWKIDIPANRYDLLCREGLVRALCVFVGISKPPSYTAAPAPKTGFETITVKRPSIQHYRPYVVGAILRNVTLDEESLKSFIELQDKLHQNVCRKRTLVSMGTHDYDTIQGPFTYELIPLEDIEFIPLNQDKKIKGGEFVAFYENDRQLSRYLHIIKEKTAFPIIKDSKGTICSLPPIINSEHSKITTKTKNIFIEITATDLTKDRVVLDTLVAMFSEYCSKPFEVEQVNVVYETDASEDYVSPGLQPRTLNLSVERTNNLLGLQFSREEIVKFCQRMSLGAKASPSEPDSITIEVPITRHDILHPVDVIEDVGIAFGYNNIPKKLPTLGTIASPRPINKLSDHVRRELAACGYYEILALTLCSEDENSSWLGRDPNMPRPVRLLNPKTVEFQVIRTTLMPGLLKTMAHSLSKSLPIKIFEVGDVVVQDLSTRERQTAAFRHVGVLYSAKASGFEHVHGVLDRLMLMLSVQRDPQKGYSLKESEDPSMFPGRCAQVMLRGKRVGLLGVVHPTVLSKFDVPYPSSYLELDLSDFV